MDDINTGAPAELVVVVPLSSSRAPSALRPEVSGVAGVDRPSRAICRGVRAVARARLLRNLGVLTPASVVEVERALALVLGLGESAPAG
jgi:mRNA interferase MazF